MMNRMISTLSRNKVAGIIAAVVLAAVGTLTLVGWAKSAENRAVAGERTVDVLVVKEAVAQGTSAEDLGGRVDTKQVVAKVKANDGVDELDDLKGKVASVDLVPGEQLLASRFVEPAQLVQDSRGVEVPEGLQEVTISLEPQRAVGGNLSPGDTVGLVASFEPFEMFGPDGQAAGKTGNETHLMLHKVLVTRVQAAPTSGGPAQGGEGDGENQGPEPAPGSDLLVTLAVDAPSVERIVFAQEFGLVWLTNEPETATEDGTRIQNRGTIYE